MPTFFWTGKWRGYPDRAVLEAWVDASPLDTLRLPVEYQQQADSLRLSVVWAETTVIEAISTPGLL